MSLPHTCRAVRLLYLIEKLHDRWFTVPELADMLCVSIWTVKRDLADLQDDPLRVPLIEDEGRWRVMQR